MKNYLVAGLFAAVLVSAAAPAFGQTTTGTLVGTVIDKSGAGIPNADLSIVNEATQVKYAVKSDAAGEYRLQDLPAGLYDVTVTAASFSPTTIKAVGINALKSSTVPVTLGLTSSQNVEVSTVAAVTLDTQTIQLQTTFTTVESQNLPASEIGGQGVLNLALLAPGVTSGGGIGAGTGPSVGGQRTRNNNYQLEGIDNNNQSVAGPSTAVPNDAVGEFSLLTNMYSPEFGHSTGGQFNTTIVSGTNSFHGGLFEYFQNRKLEAQDQTTKLANNYGTSPRFDYNRFGGQIGGPVLRDRLFFFSTFTKAATGQSLSRSACAPTPAGYTALAAIPSVSATNLSILQKYVPAATGPDISNSCPSSGTITVSGTTIPLGQISFSPPVFTNTYISASSMDYTLNQKNNFRFRYVYNTQAAQDTIAQLPVFFQAQPTKNHFISIGYFHSFTANLTNEFRLGFNRYVSTTPSGSYSFPGLDSFPNLQFADVNLQLGPNPNAPQDNIQNLYQATDNITWVKGKQTITVGFDGRKYIAPSHFTQRVRGDYDYSTLDLYLRDLSPDQLGERSSGNFEYYGDQTALYGYANDIYRVAPKVTINAGLRYEFTSVNVGNRAQILNSAASVPGVVNFGVPQPQYKNFAPRVGIAFAPGNGDTSIRAGFGIGYDVLFTNLGTLSKPPQYSGTQDTTISVQTPNFLKGGGLPPGPGTLLTYPTIAAQRAATSAYIPDQKLPYSEQWDLSIQHVFLKNYTAEVRYLGSRGIHLPAQIQLNRQAEVTPSNNLPVFFGPNSGAGLTNTLSAIRGPFTTTSTATGPKVNQYINQFTPAWRTAGFGPQSTTDPLTYNSITSYQPRGGSNYNGLAAQLTRRMSNGLLLNVSYTFSKSLDNSTAEVFSTTLSPRRPQDFSDLASEYSVSALDRRHRFTAEVLYDFKPFHGGNYFLRNIAGNWLLAPVYTFQSPEYFTPQSGVDSNLNGDAVDRTVINPQGVRGTGSASTAIVVGGNTVGYVAKDPNAYYVQAGVGALPNGARNTEPMPRTNNLDLSAVKRFQVYERLNMEFGASALNVLNHPQFVGGNISTINTPSASSYTGFVQVANSKFNAPQKSFSSNPRFLQLDLKLTF